MSQVAEPNANGGRRLEVVVDGLPYSEDANWPSTQPLLEPSMPVGQLVWERQTGMEWHSWRRDDAKKPPFQSQLALAADVVWSCWEVKWEAGGLLKHEVS